ncbi:MAG: hypothetical protein E6538_14670 [Paeniclostridium sordellii]|nr:hypothetical protein [Paeniclostridium sordellii]
MNNIIFNNNNILDFLKSDEASSNDYVLILQLIKELSFTVEINHDEDILMKIYEELAVTRNYNENKKIISILLEKYSKFIEQDEYNNRLKEVNSLIDRESKEFKDVIRESFIFDSQNGMVGFDIDNLDEGIRHAKNINELKEVLLILALKHNKIEDFMHDVFIILENLIFDENIIDGIEKLNDGFEKRKNEIIYHLYCIETEVPKIISRNITGYREIGDQMTISCSPESKRYDELKKYIDGNCINCELHTKMKRLSAKAPDRIYFCPNVPNDILKEDNRHIFIYKITKHI